MGIADFLALTRVVVRAKVAAGGSRAQVHLGATLVREAPLSIRCSPDDWRVCPVFVFFLVSCKKRICAPTPTTLPLAIELCWGAELELSLGFQSGSVQMYVHFSSTHQGSSSVQSMHGATTLPSAGAKLELSLGFQSGSVQQACLSVLISPLRVPML